MKKHLALLGLIACASVYAQQPKNVVSVDVPILTITSQRGQTNFTVNGYAGVRYDRSLTRLISVVGAGTIRIESTGRQTTTTLGLVGGVRFWFFRNFSGLYMGPYAGLYTSGITYFVLGGDIGYRIYLARKFALSFGGGPEVRFGSGSSIIAVGGYVSVGYPF